MRPSRPERIRRKPLWQTSGDYNMYANFAFLLDSICPDVPTSYEDANNFQDSAVAQSSLRRD